MKAADQAPKGTGTARWQRRAKSPQPGQPRGRLEGAKAVQSQAQPTTGGYKRIEVLLGVEATIALRQLMRDGRSAREVIEALLVAERHRRKDAAAGR